RVSSALKLTLRAMMLAPCLAKCRDCVCGCQWMITARYGDSSRSINDLEIPYGSIRTHSHHYFSLAQGMPDCFGGPVVTNSCAFYHCTRGCRCTERPAFPVPSPIGGHDNAELGRKRVARRRRRVSIAVVASHRRRREPEDPR